MKKFFRPFLIVVGIISAFIVLLEAVDVITEIFPKKEKFDLDLEEEDFASC